MGIFDVKDRDNTPSLFDDKSKEADGPFSGPINRMLSESFGRSLGGINVTRDGDSNRALNAKAHTVGTSISLGDDVHEDVSDPSSMQIISHEVAHALAGGGSGKKFLDGGRNDAGEREAHAASDTFRDYVQGGAKGSAPRLQAASGGQAMVHRFEAGEHANAVNNAANTMRDAGRDVDPAVAAQMARPITLANGVTVTQGQITAMMGDFYGAFTTDATTGRESFDPARSFDAMNNANPEEMQVILDSISNEERNVNSALRQNAAGTGPNAETPVDPGPLEVLTGTRRDEPTLNADGSTTRTGLSFLELAQKNSSHFNTEDESGTDNNMGAYNAFQQMSLQAAQQAAAMPPGPERDAAEQRALAMQASGQHFLTDRFSSGHQFDKGQMLDANGGGVVANIKARIFHEEDAESGLNVTNSRGETWLTMDDQHWADRENAENRVRVAQATTDSYGELNAVLSGQRTPEEIQAGGYAARDNTPVFDSQHNDDVQRRAREMSTFDALTHEEIVPSIPGTAYGLGARYYGKAQNFCEDVGNTVSEGAGKAWDWTTDTAEDVADTAGEAWDWTKNTASDVADTASETAGEAWDWTRNTASDVADTASETAGEAWDWTRNTASDVADTASETAGEAWDWTRNTASDVADTVVDTTGAVIDTVSDTASDVADAASETAGEAWRRVSSWWD